MARVTLVEAQPWDPTTGAVVPVRLAGGGRRHYRHKGHADWLAGVVASPLMSAGIEFDGGFTGGAVPTSSAIGFMPARRDARARIARLMWAGAPITVSVGDDAAAEPDWTIELAGKVAGYGVQRGSFTFTIASLAGRLNDPLVTATFSGKGGIEGSEQAAGRLKRRTWGRAWSVEGRLLDAAYNIYEFGDPARPLRAFDAVKDKGRAGPAVLVAWAGSIDETLIALKAAVTPDGGCAAAPSIACVKWSTQPSVLTANLRGEIGGGYVESVAGIAAAISAAAGGPAVVDLAAAIAARPEPAGIHVEDAGERGVAALDRVLLRASMGWEITPAGMVELAPIAFDAPVAEIVANSVDREAAYAPVTSVSVGWRRNHRRHTTSEISAAVTAGDVTFADGTTAEDMKPTQPGADKTSDNTAKDTAHVGGRPTSSVLDSIAGNTFAQVMAAADGEVARLRTRALNFPGPAGEDSYTLHRREVTERKTADDVFAEIFDILGARTPDGQSFVINTATVRISGDESFAQRFDSIAATFAKNKASIEHIDQVLVGPDGAEARALTTVDVNGRVIGTALTNDGTEGGFTVSADTFRIEDPDTGLPYFYADDTGKVLMHDVEVDTLKVGAVSYDAMQLGAAQKTAFYVLPTTVNVPKTSTVEICSLSFVKEDTDSILEILVQMKCASDDDFQFDATIQIDGMVMDTTPVNVVLVRNDARLPITPFTYASGISAGPHTVSVKIYNRETDADDLSVLVGSTLKVTELRKASIGSSTGSGGAIPSPGTPGGGSGGGYNGGNHNPTPED